MISRISTTLLWSFLLLLFITPAKAQQNLTAIHGLVTDVMDGLPLQGATIALSRQGVPGIVDGTTSNQQGKYQLTQLRPGKYQLTVRYIGYVEFERVVILSPGQTYTFDVGLEQSSIDLNTIVVSASRNEEKVLNAVSSISVVTDHELQHDITTSSASTIRLVTGVDHAQTGIDRREIALRGFNNSVTGETYVLTDFRLSAVPGIAVNAYGLMPIATLDMDRVEVVRGPGAALYGAGVDQGLIHFITKSPFSYPGTSISVGGGERSLMSGEFRHAGVFNNFMNGALGYKFTGHYASANDWELDADDPIDSALIAREGGTGRDSDYWKYGFNGAIEYRPNRDTRITFNGGHLSQKMAMLTGIGTAQTDNFAYTFGQVRVEAGNFSAQAYLNKNNSGDSFYYGPTALTDQQLRITDKTMLVNTQAQYKFSLLEGREQLLIGADYKMTRPDTEDTLHGRNENDDAIDEFGAFLQSTTSLTHQIDLTAAVRTDYNNIDSELRLSPRLGMVVELMPGHTFRLAANRAYGAPGLNPNFLDLNVSTLFTAASFGLTLQGRGARDGFTFNNYRNSQEVTFLLPDSGDLLGGNSPAFFGSQMALNQISITPVYENFAIGLREDLLNGNTLSGSLNTLTTSERTRFAQLLEQLAPFIGGNTTGQLGIPSLTSSEIDLVTEPRDIAPLKQTETSTLEAGYKGMLGSKLVLAIDAYVSQKKNFVGPLRLESPYVYLPELRAALRDQIAPLLGDLAEADPDLDNLLNNLDANPADFIAGLAAEGYNDFGGFSNSPVAIVEPDQTVLANSADPTTIGALLTYRNFGTLTLWGVDIALEYRFSDRLRLFGSTSFVSDDLFDNSELDEENTSLAVALNAPAFKATGGFDYQFPRGFSFRMSSRHISEFPVISGPFTGIIENYTVIDAGLGYDFGRFVSGLRFDVTAQNLLTFVNGKPKAMHREFAGAPKVGRIAMARMVFTF